MEVAGCTIESNVDVTSTFSQNNITCFCFPAGQNTYTSLMSFSGYIAYNSGTDRCEYCSDGCSTCFVDVDICTSCKAGYEFHPDSYTCARAELGLAAAILAVSIILEIVVIIGCMKAKKE